MPGNMASGFLHDALAGWLSGVCGAPVFPTLQAQRLVKIGRVQLLHTVEYVQQLQAERAR